MKMRTLIVDDEAVARRRIARLLAERDDVEILGECHGGRPAVQEIARLRPDLVFLDVQMPDMDGFDVLKHLDQDTLPAVIFVTAYDKYALRAFDAAAVDYLLKPFEPDRFSEAVDRAVRWKSASRVGETDERLTRLLHQVIRREQDASVDFPSEPALPAARGPLDRFMVKHRGRTEFIRVCDVDWIESDGNYIQLHVGQTKHLVRSTITSCADRLNPRQFVRVHRRYIVNTDRIKEIQPWFGGDYVIVLTTGQKVRLSRNYREQFESRMLGD
jgi:two-component system LytT family response regulator